MIIGDYNKRDNEMALNKIKKIVWNLLGTLIFLCAGVVAVFHTILGY